MGREECCKLTTVCSASFSFLSFACLIVIYIHALRYILTVINTYIHTHTLTTSNIVHIYRGVRASVGTSLCLFQFLVCFIHLHLFLYILYNKTSRSIYLYWRLNEWRFYETDSYSIVCYFFRYLYLSRLLIYLQLVNIKYSNTTINNSINSLQRTHINNYNF